MDRHIETQYLQANDYRREKAGNKQRNVNIVWRLTVCFFFSRILRTDIWSLLFDAMNLCRNHIYLSYLKELYKYHYYLYGQTYFTVTKPRCLIYCISFPFYTCYGLWSSHNKYQVRYTPTVCTPIDASYTVVKSCQRCRNWTVISHGRVVYSAEVWEVVSMFFMNIFINIHKIVCSYIHMKHSHVYTVGQTCFQNYVSTLLKDLLPAILRRVVPGGGGSNDLAGYGLTRAGAKYLKLIPSVLI